MYILLDIYLPGIFNLLKHFLIFIVPAARNVWQDDGRHRRIARANANIFGKRYTLSTNYNNSVL